MKPLLFYLFVLLYSLGESFSDAAIGKNQRASYNILPLRDWNKNDTIWKTFQLVSLLLFLGAATYIFFGFDWVVFFTSLTIWSIIHDNMVIYFMGANPFKMFKEGHNAWLFWLLNDKQKYSLQVGIWFNVSKLLFLILLQCL